MNGIDPYGYLQQVSMNLERLNTHEEIETVLDEIEYLFEIIPPELQENAEALITILREKLKNVSQ